MLRNASRMSTDDTAIYEGLFVDIIKELSTMLKFGYVLEVVDDGQGNKRKSGNTPWTYTVEKLTAGVCYNHRMIKQSTLIDHLVQKIFFFVLIALPVSIRFCRSYFAFQFIYKSFIHGSL